MNTISNILHHIDTGHIALPEFQRGYVWGRDQVRGLFESLYRGHPVGSLLVWATESEGATHRGDGPLGTGVVKLLLDGQQRMTTLYGVTRGRPPAFFDGNKDVLTGLCFNVEKEQFAFYQPVMMKDDPCWIDVHEVLSGGHDKTDAIMGRFDRDNAQIGKYWSRLSRLLNILNISIHIEEVAGQDKTIDVVVDIFNKVNSGGTKLSKGDLALAKICAEWPEGRHEMKRNLMRWSEAGYDFNLDWLLRSTNTVLTGEAKFHYLHDRPAHEVRGAVRSATRHVDACLNMIAGRLGLDHSRVLFSRFALPVMVRYLDRKDGTLSEVERDKLLFWFAQTGMWGRYSGSTETFIDKDLEALESGGYDVDALISELRLWQGSLRVESGHFRGWSLGARFYPVLYMLTRMGEAKDWGNGLPLKASLLGRMNKLEVHHIFPKSQLYDRGASRAETNALANFCFLTKDTNLAISNRLPEEYFFEVEERHPGALASQWIPMDDALWRIDRYSDFLEARQELLAAETNRQLASLLHGDERWMAGGPSMFDHIAVPGGITDEDIPALEALNRKLSAAGLMTGEIGYELADPVSGRLLAILDAAWPRGLRGERVDEKAALVSADEDAYRIADEAGFRCYRSADKLLAAVLGEGGASRAA